MSKAGAAEGQGERYAVSYPPAMYAGDILADPAFAAAMGYGWLHEEETEFVRSFRLQVKRQADLYERWLNGQTEPTKEPE